MFLRLLCLFFFLGYGWSVSDVIVSIQHTDVGIDISVVNSEPIVGLQFTLKENGEPVPVVTALVSAYFQGIVSYLHSQLMAFHLL